MVYITGYGVVSALGMNVSENLDSLLCKRNVFGPARVLKTVHNNLPVGEIAFTDDQLRDSLNITNSVINRTTLLGIWALGEALKDLSQDKYANAALINATTVGGMDAVEKYYAQMIRSDAKMDTKRYLQALDASYCTREMATFYGIKGFHTTISTACSSAVNAIQFGAKLIEQGQTNIAICGGTDGLSKFTLNGFNSLKNIDSQLCKPFDEHRNGLNLGEGAAYLVLESEVSVKERNAQPLAVLAGYANTNEAYHATAPAPNGQGALRTMKKALEKGNIEAKQIDFISAHGTATLGNDISEGNAIERLFGKTNYPPFASIKSYTGHTLAASGSIEAIFSCLMLQKGFLPASLRFKTPMKGLSVRPIVETLMDQNVNYILNNSFGFGGNDTSIVLKKAV